jgi:hypothetical protein
MPSACAKNFESYAVRFEVIRCLATLTIPNRQVVSFSDQEKADCMLNEWNTMCDTDGRWWTFTAPESLAHDYDLLFAELPIYRTTIKRYFSSYVTMNKDVAFLAADGKRERYISAGGRFA